MAKKAAEETTTIKKSTARRISALRVRLEAQQGRRLSEDTSLDWMIPELIREAEVNFGLREDPDRR